MAAADTGLTTVDEELDADDEEPMSGILRHEVAELRQSLAASQAMLRFIGQVMGACHCWGCDKRCIVCAGFGSPGFRRSADPQLFLAWVEPALSRLDARVVRASFKQGSSTGKSG